VAVVLPDDYYLRNFSELIHFVSSTYSSILTPAEQAYARTFIHLPEPAQRLYIRLLCRSRNFFRQHRLSYPEIENLKEAVSVLTEKDFIQVNSSTEAAALLPLFTREELFHRFSSVLPKSTRRPELLNWISETFAESEIVATLYQDEPVLEVLHESIFSVYRLCFFGNLYQDMTEFVLRDLGLTQFESYVIDDETRVYHSREQLEAHVQYYRCYEDYDAEQDKTVETILGSWASLPSVEQGDPHLRRRVERFTNKLGRELERLQEHATALTLYQSNQRPPSRERQSRLYVRLEQPEKAIALCEQILAAPVDEEEREFALQFGARTAKKLAVKWAAPTRLKPAETTLTLPVNTSVEMAVCEVLAKDGECYYTENTLFNSVFGLVFWEVIFAPINGMFFNPFQSGPADLYEPDFSLTRRQQIAEVLTELNSSESLCTRVFSTMQDKAGLQNAFVNWRYLSDELVAVALQRIPLDHWNAIFQRLLADLRNHRTGLPDLVHFPEQGGYRLVEVKGPGDKLQKNQQRWMRFFTEVDIPHQVVHVTWLED